MIVLMGVAGAGKGTQGEMLRAETGFDYISTGEMLRQFASDSQRERMLAGELLSDQEIIAMVEEAMAAIPNPEQCILDGFPRTLVQVEWLLEQCEKGRFKLPVIINLEINEETVHRRLRLRGRQDDAEHVISRRFREYHSITVPVIGLFRNAGAEVLDIDADQDQGAVHDDIAAALQGKVSYTKA